MDLNINGDPGEGNTYIDIKIGYAQNVNPNAKTVINYNYGNQKPDFGDDNREMPDEEKAALKTMILDYIAPLKAFVIEAWSNKIDALWDKIIGLKEVDAVIYKHGKQDSPYNRNLVANIICMMRDSGIYKDDTDRAYTIALEGDYEKPVRPQLSTKPSETIRKVIAPLLPTVQKQKRK